jgi:hypothetical protein
MEEYKAYLLGPDGHVFRRIDLVCRDENAAKERAQQLAEHSGVELWQGERKIAEFQALAIRICESGNIKPIA